MKFTASDARRGYWSEDPGDHAFCRRWSASRRGVDFSLAPFPSPETSIGAALESLGGQPLGPAGSLAAAAVLTEPIDRARFPRCGFSGLMLPVLEDAVLVRRVAEGYIQVGQNSLT
jgi:uncharacterized protein (UPF0210 family)